MAWLRPSRSYARSASHGADTPTVTAPPRPWYVASIRTSKTWYVMSYNRCDDRSALAVAAMFTPDQLRAWSVSYPPPRAVRKTLFTLRLWRPSRDRRPVAATAAAAPGRNVSQPQSADSLMSVAWMNTQSLRNKTGDKGLDVLALTETIMHRSGPLRNTLVASKWSMGARLD